MKRSEQKEQTRAALLEAARACFAEAGYAATQIGDIAKRAGVAHGTVYVHFADKGALVDALLANFNEALLAKLERTWEKKAEEATLELTRALASTCLDHWKKERELLAAFAERAGSQAGLQALQAGVSPKAAALVEARIAPLVGAMDPELVVHAMLGMWLRVGLRYVFGPTLSKKTAVETLARMSLGALAAVVETPR